MQIAVIEVIMSKLEAAFWGKIPGGVKKAKIVVRNDGFDICSDDGKVNYYRAICKVQLLITPEQCNTEWERMTREAETAEWVD